MKKIIASLQLLIMTASLFFLMNASIASAWTWNANFDSGTPGTRALGTSGFNGLDTGTLTVFSNVHSHSGSQACLFPWTTGTTGYNEFTGEINYPSSVAQGGEIWLRAYYYFDAGWSWDNAGGGYGGTKILRNRTTAPWGTYNSITTNRTGRLVLSNEPGSYQSANYDMEPSSTATFDIGRWQSIELYIKFSATPGQGIMRIWKDGVLLLENLIQPTLAQSSNVSTGALVMSMWNLSTVQAQNEWVDDVVITTDTPSNRDAAGNVMIGPTDWSNSSPVCTSFTYTDWNTCQSNNVQSRTIISSSPSGCVGGSPILTQSCTSVTTYNLTNFTQLVTDWLKTISSPADVNSDGKVDSRDLGIMLSNWN